MCSLVATIKQARPDLLPEVKSQAVVIPEVMPIGYTHQTIKRTSYVEGVGEPTTACFLTEMNTDPTNWSDTLLSLFLQKEINFLATCLPGGCSRNMMGCERFGILTRRPFIRGKERNLRCPSLFANQCQQTSSWTGSYGMIHHSPKQKNNTIEQCVIKVWERQIPGGVENIQSHRCVRDRLAKLSIHGF